MTRKLMRTLIEITDHKFDDPARTLHQGIAIVQKWPHVVMVGSARETRTEDNVREQEKLETTLREMLDCPTLAPHASAGEGVATNPRSLP